jgi:hypothetical protein
MLGSVFGGCCNLGCGLGLPSLVSHRSHPDAALLVVSAYRFSCLTPSIALLLSRLIFNAGAGWGPPSYVLRCVRGL